MWINHVSYGTSRLCTIIAIICRYIRVAIIALFYGLNVVCIKSNVSILQTDVSRIFLILIIALFLMLLLVLFHKRCLFISLHRFISTWRWSECSKLRVVRIKGIKILILYEEVQDIENTKICLSRISCRVTRYGRMSARDSYRWRLLRPNSQSYLRANVYDNAWTQTRGTVPLFIGAELPRIRHLWESPIVSRVLLAPLSFYFPPRWKMSVAT